MDSPVAARRQAPRRGRLALQGCSLLIPLLLAVLAGPAAAQCPDGDSPFFGGGWLLNYEGSIADRHRIRMSLSVEGHAVSGLYTDATQLKDIRVSGRIGEGSTIALDEYDAAGQVVARFEGVFPERDPKGRFGEGKLGCEVIVGRWRRQDGEADLPFELVQDSATAGTFGRRYALAGAAADEPIHRHVQRFWEALKRDDRPGVAALIRYPIRVTLGGRTRRIAGPRDLLAHYDAIFTPPYRQAILQAIPRYLFVRSEGIMLGHGEVWFGADGKVIALNTF